MTTAFAFRGSAAALLLAIAAAVPAGAQGTGTFQGRVFRDSSRIPIDSVEVLVAGMPPARTDSTGRFVIKDVPVGRHAATLRRLGYRPLDGNIRLDEAGQVIDLTFTMWRLARNLDTVRVAAKGLAAAGIATSPTGAAEFDRRHAAGIGKFLTADDFKTHPNATLKDIIQAEIPGVLLIRLPGSGAAIAGKRAISTSMSPSPRSNFFGGAAAEDACYMQVWVDGQRIYSYKKDPNYPPPNLDDYLGYKLAAIEIYRGAAETPTEFSTTGADCGTLVIWTAKR